MYDLFFPLNSKFENAVKNPRTDSFLIESYGIV